MNAKRRVAYIQDLLTKIGLEPGRVRMFQMSSAQAAQFADAARQMAEQIDNLGPSPLRKRIDVPQDKQAEEPEPDENNSMF